jgi:hypothetical protein
MRDEVDDAHPGAPHPAEDLQDLLLLRDEIALRLPPHVGLTVRGLGQLMQMERGLLDS